LRRRRRRLYAVDSRRRRRPVSGSEFLHAAERFAQRFAE